MVYIKKVKHADLTKAEEFATVKRMRATYGDQFTYDPCTWCGHWCVVDDVWGALHPECYDDPARQRSMKRAPDANQGAFGL